MSKFSGLYLNKYNGKTHISVKWENLQTKIFFQVLKPHSDILDWQLKLNLLQNPENNPKQIINNDS